MKREIMTIRRVITPQRDMISNLNAGMVQLPGMTDQGSAYAWQTHQAVIGDTYTNWSAAWALSKASAAVSEIG